jgi:hypothetical protein
MSGGCVCKISDPVNAITSSDRQPSSLWLRRQASSLEVCTGSLVLAFISHAILIFLPQETSRDPESPLIIKHENHTTTLAVLITLRNAYDRKSHGHRRTQP